MGRSARLRAEQDLAWTCSTSFTLPRSLALKPLLLPQAKTMAEVMNLFCSPSPAPSAPLPRPTPAGGGDDDGDEDEDPVPDFGIPALHPDLPMCASASPQGPRRTAKGIKLALLHTLPVSQVRPRRVTREIRPTRDRALLRLLQVARVL